MDTAMGSPTSPIADRIIEKVEHTVSNQNH